MPSVETSSTFMRCGKNTTMEKEAVHIDLVRFQKTFGQHVTFVAFKENPSLFWRYALCTLYFGKFTLSWSAICRSLGILITKN